MEAIYPVAGVGGRREVSSLHNICDSCCKAGIDGRRLKIAIEQLEKMPKKSLQETERLLKKHGPSPPFLACKALALVRHSPNNLKAQRAAQELIDIIPVRPDLDELTVLCVIHFYQHTTADYASLHEFLQKLVAVNRTNSDMLDLIWLTYFRHHNFKDMQKAVMDLAKVDASSADKHFIIGVLGLVMQALDGTDRAKKRLLQTLAYRTMDKRFPQVPPKSDEAVLKLWLLSEIGDVEGCLSLLADGFQGSEERPGIRQSDSHHGVVRQVCRLLANANRLDEAEGHLWATEDGNLVGDFIEILADVLVRRLLTLTTQNGQTPADQVKAILEMLDSSLPGQSLALTTMSHLQLLRRLNVEGNPSHDEWIQSALVEELLRYYSVAGDRPCCFADVRNFLPLLIPIQFQQLLAHLNLSDHTLSLTESLTHPSFTTISEVIRHQNLLILQFSLRNMTVSAAETASAPDRAQVMANVKSLLALRVHVTELDCLSKLQTPDMVKLGDPYAMLACYTLFDMFRTKQDKAVFIDAIVLLESTLTKPKPFCNPSLRILLIHLYLRYGAVRQAYSHFAQMDIKSLQLNHLSFLVTSATVMQGVEARGLDLLNSMIRFYTGAIFDCFDFQLQCITRDKHDYFSLVQLEELKSDFKYSFPSVYANYMRLWSLPTIKSVTDVEVRVWMQDTDRYLGPTPLSLLKDFADRGVVPSWDTAFDMQETDRERQIRSRELAWLSILNSQMALYRDAFALGSTYWRYNPFVSTPFKYQLLDHVPASHVPSIEQGVSAVRRSSDLLFEASKSAGELLPQGWRTDRQENVRHLVADSFPHPLPFYLSLGCHAVHLRLGQLTAAVDTLVSSGVQTAAGQPAFPLEEPAKADEEVGGGENGPTRKPFGVIIRSLEIGSKLQQMIHDVFSAFDDCDKESVYRYRDMILGVSLLTQVIRCSVWIIECIQTSLLTLSANNDKRKDARGRPAPESVQFRLVMEDWFLGLALFLEDIQHAIHVLAERLHTEADKLQQTVKRIPQESENLNCLNFPLCGDEPSAEVRLEMTCRLERDIELGWHDSLKQLCSVMSECGRLLTGFSAQARAKIKSKSKAASVTL